MKQLDEQRYFWLFRVLGIFLVISIFLNITLLASFEKISPTVKKEVFFVSSGNENIESLYITNTDSNYEIALGNVGYEIAKNYISSYIIDRETIYSDLNLIEENWWLDSQVFYLSSKDVYNEFMKSQIYQNTVSSNIRNKIVSVKSCDVEYQPTSKKWIANIVLKISDATGLNSYEEQRKIIVYARFLTSDNIKKTFAKKWVNPLGFEIYKYEYEK